MKKLFALLLALSMIFTLSACKGEEKTEPTTTKAPTTEAVLFKAPENYATVLVVKINPEFKLYLNEKGEVLVVEPVNDDAKIMAKDVENIKGDLETVVQTIFTASDKAGFVKENATVNFQITVVKDESINTEEILKVAKDTTVEVFKDSKKNIEVSTSVAEDALQEAETTTGNTTKADTTTTKNQTTKSATTQHKHSYSAATCTSPKKCSCGATEGKALGHNYSNGTCTVCGLKDPSYVPYTSVKTKAGKWNAKFLSGNSLYDINLVLCSSTGNASAGYSIGVFVDPNDEAMQNTANQMPEFCENYQGKLYYFGMGGGLPISSITESGTTVTVVDETGAKLVLTRTSETAMKVTSAGSGFAGLSETSIPVGTVFTIS